MSASPTVYYGGVIFSAFPLWYAPRLPGPGVYLLCRRDPEGREVLYVGETANLADRLGPDHEFWTEALALGMNEVLVHLLAVTPSERLAVETRLRRLHPAPLHHEGASRPPDGLAPRRRPHFTPIRSTKLAIAGRARARYKM